MWMPRTEEPSFLGILWLNLVPILFFHVWYMLSILLGITVKSGNLKILAKETAQYFKVYLCVYFGEAAQQPPCNNKVQVSCHVYTICLQICLNIGETMQGDYEG